MQQVQALGSPLTIEGIQLKNMPSYLQVVGGTFTHLLSDCVTTNASALNRAAKCIEVFTSQF